MSLLDRTLDVKPFTARVPSSIPAKVARVSLCIVLAAILMPTCGQAEAQTVISPPPTSGTSLETLFANLVSEAALRFGLPPAWINAVMRAESAGNVRAVSPKGAMGLMQIMPQTWDDLRDRYGLGVDPFDPHDNVMAGAAYLRELHDRYGGAGFLAAYNAGPARYESHLATGQPLPVETQAYIAGLARLLQTGGEGIARRARGVVRTWRDAPLFAAQAEGSAGVDPTPTNDAQIPSRPAAGFAPAPPTFGLFVVQSNAGMQP